MRPTTSLALPAVNGITTLMVRDGQVWADAMPAVPSTSAEISAAVAA
jgi:hypothetical protein